MESLIFAFVSLVLLVPILFILPLGLKARGKVTVIVSSFLLAIIGFLAEKTFSVWQSSLIVVLLALLTAYIMDKRLGRTIFVHNTPENKSTIIEKIKDSQMELVEVEQVLPKVTEKLENKQNELIEQEEITFQPSKEEIVGKEDGTKDQEEASNSEDVSIDEDISFLINRNQLDEDSEDTNAVDYSAKSVEMNYMEEIEKMLEAENDLDDWIEAKEIQHSKTKAEAVNAEAKDRNRINRQESKRESSPIFEDDVELEEFHFDGLKKSNEEDEVTTASTWEEDEIQPLHFEDCPDSLQKKIIRK